MKNVFLELLLEYICFSLRNGNKQPKCHLYFLPCFLLRPRIVLQNSPPFKLSPSFFIDQHCTWTTECHFIDMVVGNPCFLCFVLYPLHWLLISPMTAVSRGLWSGFHCAEHGSENTFGMLNQEYEEEEPGCGSRWGWRVRQMKCVVPEQGAAKHSVFLVASASFLACLW